MTLSKDIDRKQDRATSRGRATARGLALGALALLTLAGCDALRRNNGAPEFDGAYFRAKLTPSEVDRSAFSVWVLNPEKTLAGAREAGRYEAVKYCIQTFGSSEITWVQSPDVPLDQLSYDDSGRLVISGACNGW